MKLKSFSRLSAYARAESHLVQQTAFGAAGKLLSTLVVVTPAFCSPTCLRPDEHGCCAVTLTGVVLAVILFSNELAEYLKPFSIQTVSNAE